MDIYFIFLKTQFIESGMISLFSRIANYVVKYTFSIIAFQIKILHYVDKFL